MLRLPDGRGGGGKKIACTQVFMVKKVFVDRKLKKNVQTKLKDQKYLRIVIFTMSFIE